MDVNIEEFNFETLTLGEAEDLESMLGVSLDKMEDASQVKMMRAVVFLVARRSDPDFVYEDTADMQVSEVAEMLGGNSPS